jgi:D-3-phosphoglycerate dehydrogenase
MKILVSCPPMLGMLDEFLPFAATMGLTLVPAKVTQTLSEEDLMAQLPHYDGWIIGDDPATRRVFEAGKSGKLKAAVKWGIGTDNVDFDACKELNIPVINTPLMFGKEVADVALGYIIGLARQLFFIDREVRLNHAWPKPAGTSLAGKKIAVVGLGDIGSNLVKRLIACDMVVTGYDPSSITFAENILRRSWPEDIEYQDFIVFTCSLNDATFHMLNSRALSLCKDGIFIINVARGPLIDESALINALKSGKVKAAALDVFEEEPLPQNSKLKDMPSCIFGTHNGSNTKEAVIRASHIAIERMHKFLSDKIDGNK